MTVKQLNRDMLIELKERYLMDKLDETENRTPSWGELADADETVSDETIYEEYGCYDFGVDDFFCTAGQYDLQDKLEGIA